MYGDIFVHKMNQCDNTDSTITQTSCETFTLNGQNYTTSGTYIQTRANARGCDSTITLNLVINHVTTGIDFYWPEQAGALRILCGGDCRVTWVAFLKKKSGLDLPIAGSTTRIKEDIEQVSPRYSRL